jgi:hypothetical protein
MSVVKSRNEIPSIDVSLVTIETAAGYEYGFDTANQIEVEPQVEETDAVKLVVKGKLRAQKPKDATITGHEITLHDNVFNPELVKTLQGGTVEYWQDSTHTTKGTTPTEYGFAKYTPPVAGSGEKGEIFKLNAYSAIYNAAGVITGYEKTTYPNCQGQPVAFNSEDGTFRAPEYTINSAPDTGEAPYEITWVADLPDLIEPGVTPVYILGTDATTTYDSGSASVQTYDASTMFTTTPASGIGAITYDIISGAGIASISGSTITLTGTGAVAIKATVAATTTTSSASDVAVLTVNAA